MLQILYTIHTVLLFSHSHTFAVQILLKANLCRCQFTFSKNVHTKSKKNKLTNMTLYLRSMKQEGVYCRKTDVQGFSQHILTGFCIISFPKAYCHLITKMHILQFTTFFCMSYINPPPIASTLPTHWYILHPPTILLYSISFF